MIVVQPAEFSCRMVLRDAENIQKAKRFDPSQPGKMHRLT